MNPTDSPPPDTADDSPDNPARTVIAAFGGIRPMAAKLGVPVTTVQGWKKRGVIPANRRDEIAAAAQTHDIAIAGELLLAAAPDDEERAAGVEEAAADSVGMARPETAGSPVPAESPWAPTTEPPAQESVRPAAEAPEPAAPPSDPPALAVDRPSDDPPPAATATVADRRTGPEPETPPSERRDQLPPPAPSGSGRGLAWLAVILAILVGAAVVTRPQWEPALWGGDAAEGDLAARVAALESTAGTDADLTQRLDRLETRVGEAVGGQDAQAGTVAALSDDLAALTGRIDNLPLAAGAEELTALRDQLAALEEAVASGAAGDAGAAIALGERVAALDTALAALTDAQAAQADDLAAVAGVTQDLAELESGLAGLEAGLAARMDSLEAGVAEVGAQAAAPAPEVLERLDRFAAELAAADSMVRDLEQALAGMAAVESRLAALETLGQATDTANTTLRDSVEEIGRRLDRMNQDVAGLDAGLQTLRDDIATARAADVADQALLLALGQVRDAVSNGASYAPALGALAGLVPSGPETAGALEVLERHAATGAPTTLELMRRFGPMADQVRHAAAIPADGDWMDEALASVQGLVTIRRAPGEVEGDDADAALARAEVRLQAGDVAGAVAALESMENPGAVDAATGWLEAARSHLAVASAIQTVNGAVLARVAAAGSGTGQ